MVAANMLYFAVTLHKCGSSYVSTLLHALRRPACECDAQCDARCGDAGAVLFSRTGLTKELVDRALATDGPPSSLYSWWSSGPRKPRSCRAFVQLRHPFDVLVSQFQSFTLTHPLPPDASDAERARISADRAREHAAGVDAYAIAHLPELVRRMTAALEGLDAVADVCDVWYSRYEDMVFSIPRPMDVSSPETADLGRARAGVGRALRRLLRRRRGEAAGAAPGRVRPRGGRHRRQRDAHGLRPPGRLRGAPPAGDDPRAHARDAALRSPGLGLLLAVGVVASEHRGPRAPSNRQRRRVGASAGGTLGLLLASARGRGRASRPTSGASSRP